MNSVFESWMKRCKQTNFGLILPRGWLGRPHDNILNIKSYESNEELLTVVFDENSTVTVAGKDIVCSIRTAEAGIEYFSISNFERLEFINRWDDHSETEIFRDGKVQFVGYGLDKVR